MQDISGNKIYSVTNDKKYVITLDNFFKMCLIAFKMIVSIPIIIEGEAGIGKTALLRHVVENVFGY
jgi:ABC-type transport system involved in cytochrome c biogenesis ATPase subunit